MKRLEDVIEDGISSIIPIYDGGGNSTKMIGTDGNICVDHRRVKTILRLISQYYAVHIGACRRKYGKIINQRLGVPIVINSRLVLMPFKMRKPRFENDGAYGYVNFYDIKEIYEDDYHTKIVLNSGVEVLCMQRIRSVKKHMNDTRLIVQNIEKDELKREGKSFGKLYASREGVATMEDLARLYIELLEIKEIVRELKKKVH